MRESRWTAARVFVGLLGAASLLACGEPQEVAVAQSADAAVEGRGVPERASLERSSSAEVLSGPGASFMELRRGWRLRRDLVKQAHFATRAQGGSLSIDMGTIAARKHINGGWRSGWSPVPRSKDGETWFEANTRSARVFFKHTRGGYDRLLLRMRAVKSSNKVTVYINDKSLETIKVDAQWRDYILKVPRGGARDGENEVLLRMSAETTKAGRNQSVLVSEVSTLAPGAGPESAPRGQRARGVQFGSVRHEAVVAAMPQSFTWRLQLPEGKPALGFAWGVGVPGVELKVTAQADGDAVKTLLAHKAVSGDEGRWHDTSVDVSSLAGRVVELTMSAEGAWPEGQLVAWGAPGVYSPSSEAVSLPEGSPAQNVLIYLIDTMRYDKFSTYNASSKTQTPHIDAFAKDATVFEAAYDNENWTKPSCATILTGLYPDTHKTKKDSSKLPGDALMLSEHLKKQGFKTGSFIANGYVSNAFGFDQGWDYYTNYIRERKNTNVDNVVDNALRWIDRQKGDRFFAYVHTIDPHVPYAPPKEFRTKYWNRAYRGPIKQRSTGDQLARIKTGKMEVGRDDKAYLEALYDGEVTFNDHHFGRLMEGLRERGLYDNTLVLIIADHGEEFWDHGSVGHGHSLYEEMIHSPMIMRYPGRLKAGVRVPHVVSMVDLVPSVLDLLKLPHHGALEGVSFVDTLDTVGAPHPRLAVSDFLYRKKSVRAGRYKWISAGRKGELYDVVGDRREKSNVRSKHPIAQAYVRTQMGMFMGAEDKQRWWEGGALKGADIKLDADVADIDDELKAQLEAMGYVEGATAEPEEAQEGEE